MIDRMMRAARLDASVFELVEHDPAYTAESRRVVLLVAVIAGVGSALHSLEGGVGAAITAFVLRGAAVYVGWIAWAWISLWVGTTLTATPETESDFGETSRVLAYAQTPWILGAAVSLPVIGWGMFVAAGLWALAAATVAIRQALDFSTKRAVITVVLGWIVMQGLLIALTLLAMVVRAAWGFVA